MQEQSVSVAASACSHRPPLPCMQMNASDPTGVAGLGSSGIVSASSFRASYVVLSKQSDFINALQARIQLPVLLCQWQLHPEQCSRCQHNGMCMPPTSPRPPLFSHAVQTVRGFAARASSQLGLRVFPYSPFHIFFEQYLTIGGEALTLLGSGAGWEWGRMRLGAGHLQPPSRQKPASASHSHSPTVPQSHTCPTRADLPASFNCLPPPPPPLQPAWPSS